MLTDGENVTAKKATNHHTKVRNSSEWMQVQFDVSALILWPGTTYTCIIKGHDVPWQWPFSTRDMLHYNILCMLPCITRWIWLKKSSDYATHLKGLWRGWPSVHICNRVQYGYTHNTQPKISIWNCCLSTSPTDTNHHFSKAVWHQELQGPPLCRLLWNSSRTCRTSFSTYSSIQRHRNVAAAELCMQFLH